MNGASLTTRPVIEAVGSAGVVDTGHAHPVLAGSGVVTGGGTLSRTLQTVPVTGTATYSDLRYDVAHSGDTFRRTASSGALAPTTSALVAGAIAVRNTAPVTDAGPDQTVEVGGSAVLVLGAARDYRHQAGHIGAEVGSAPRDGQAGVVNRVVVQGGQNGRWPVAARAPKRGTRSCSQPRLPARRPG